jgi:hypothetical protein
VGSSLLWCAPTIGSDELTSLIARITDFVSVLTTDASLTLRGSSELQPLVLLSEVLCEEQASGFRVPSVIPFPHFDFDVELAAAGNLFAIPPLLEANVAAVSAAGLDSSGIRRIVHVFGSSASFLPKRQLEATTLERWVASQYVSDMVHAFYPLSKVCI